jgi:hypothetical protein
LFPRSKIKHFSHIVYGSVSQRNVSTANSFDEADNGFNTNEIVENYKINFK